jgi:hypothetical protein
MHPGPDFRITLRPLPGGDAPLPRRLALVLKYALRVASLRCLRVEEMPVAGTAAQDGRGRPDAHATPAVSQRGEAAP